MLNSMEQITCFQGNDRIERQIAIQDKLITNWSIPYLPTGVNRVMSNETSKNEQWKRLQVHSHKDIVETPPERDQLKMQQKRQATH